MHPASRVEPPLTCFSEEKITQCIIFGLHCMSLFKIMSILQNNKILKSEIYMWHTSYISNFCSTILCYETCRNDIYLFQTGFEVRTVSYGPSFPLRFMAQAQSARAINRRGKQGPVTYGTDGEDKVSKMFIMDLYCVSKGFGNDFQSRAMASNF